MKLTPIFSLLMTSLLVSGISLQAKSEESALEGLSNATPEAVAPAKKKIYFYSMDFPPDALLQHPQPATKRTEFLQALDKATRETENLQLNAGLDGADYRVEMRCGGVVWCGKLNVYILTPKRDVLASYKLPGRYIGKRDFPVVAKQLADSLSTRISEIESGDVGDFGTLHPATTP